MRNTTESPPYVGTILGEPASKSNSRKMVLHHGRLRPIKSQKALDYLSNFRLQCRSCNPLLVGDLVTVIRVFYASRRPDLDESIILDAMQGFVYVNDRQVKAKFIFHELDRKHPRCEIVVAPMEDIADILSDLHLKYDHA